VDIIDDSRTARSWSAGRLTGRQLVDMELASMLSAMRTQFVRFITLLARQKGRGNRVCNDG
jgi:hypothetical protein